MLIGVVSDTHGSLIAWEKAREALGPVEMIVHCGDVFYHGVRNPLPAGYDTLGLANALNAEAARLILVKGNCDSAVDQLVLNYPLQAPYAEIFVANRLFLCSHEPINDWEVLLQGSPGAVFIHGHTHVPLIEKTSLGFYRLNPGSVALPKDDTPPSAALMEVVPGKLKLRIINIETQEIIEELED